MTPSPLPGVCWAIRFRQSLAYLTMGYVDELGLNGAWGERRVAIRFRRAKSAWQVARHWGPRAYVVRLTKARRTARGEG